MKSSCVLFSTGKLFFSTFYNLYSLPFFAFWRRRLHEDGTKTQMGCRLRTKDVPWPVCIQASLSARTLLLLEASSEMQIWTCLLQSPACLDPAYLTNPVFYFSFPVILFPFHRLSFAPSRLFTEFCLAGNASAHSNISRFISTHLLDHFSNATFSKKSLWSMAEGWVFAIRAPGTSLPSCTYNYNEPNNYVPAVLILITFARK